jgi:hypothetical protein
MSAAKLEAIDKKYAEEEAKLTAEYEKKRAATLDISNDPALEPPVQLETGYASCVIVSNVPIVPEAMVVWAALVSGGEGGPQSLECVMVVAQG